MDKINFIGISFVIVDSVGFYLAYLYGRKTKQFRWSEYFAIIVLPIMGVFVFAYFVGIKILILFTISSFAGLALEYFFGLTYHKTLNKRLWEYKRFSINGYTSLLSIPIWGLAGIFFWFVSKLVGL